MGERCSQYRTYRRAHELRITNESSICELCLQAGNTPQTYPTTLTGKDDTFESERCAACRGSSSELVEDKGEYVCEECAAVFQAARTLLDTGIDEEIEFVPTLAFAKKAVQLRFPASRKQLAQMAAEMGFWDWFLKEFCREFRGLRPVRIVDGVLILRQELATVEVKKYARTRLLRQSTTPPGMGTK